MRKLLPLLVFCGLAAAQRHPLDPLTSAEYATAVEVLKANGKSGDSTRLPTIHLNEPPKAEVLRFQAGGDFRREAFAVVWDRAANRTAEAVIDLKARIIKSWNPVPGAQPMFTGEDYSLMQDLVRKDPAWQAAIRKRGITDFEHVQLDPWAAGNFGFADEKDIRIFRAVSLYRGTGTNAYAKPIEGVVAYVDLTHGRILKLVDSGVVPLPAATAEFDAASVKPRTAPKPLEIRQPDGGSFVIRGGEVEWQRWRFRYGIHPREGVVLYTVGYEDKGTVRPILYRGSVSEMVVPYSDPSPAWFFRGVFDEGEYGLGQVMFPLEKGTDVPAYASMLGGVLADEHGKPRDLSNPVALYERDGGVLWRHTDPDSGRVESRRARELVLSWIATVGNYDYGFNWIFHQDGTLEMDVALSGIMQTKAVAGPPDHHAHLVAKNLAAVHHQHFFNFRMDLDIDGTGGNRVSELSTAAMRVDDSNRFGNAFTMQERPLRNEREAQRLIDAASNRMWRISNPGRTNALGQPVSYLLVPGDNTFPFADPQSPLRRRAGFLNAHLWVTPFDAAEMNAAGSYMNQSPGGEGLVKWTRANRSIEDQDVVVWYTMGITHLPRPEEWPVMNAHHVGFKLVPAGFFVQNPGLDVPR
jgi:primary-amine oxidase